MPSDKRQSPANGRFQCSGVAVIGCGATARHIADLFRRAGHDEVGIVAAGVGNPDRARPDLPDGARPMRGPDDLKPGMADFVLQVAGRDAVALRAAGASRAAPRFVIATVSALVDGRVAGRISDLALAADSQSVVPAGAPAGIGALSAATAQTPTTVEHSILKPPTAWRGTEAETLCRLDAPSEPSMFCTGTARTPIRLIADPGAVRNAHHIIAEGAFGRMETRVENDPVPENPTSLELIALSVLATIRDDCARLRV